MWRTAAGSAGILPAGSWVTAGLGRTAGGKLVHSGKPVLPECLAENPARRQE